ncbi:MAG: hypothetical protein Q8P41_16805 [Pseudomonadota bacterium]|nr:hypothetical protein [Pseudomonadota bacterium]
MILALLAACDSDLPATDDTAAVDLRLTDADYPSPAANEEVWFGPEVTIAPGADEMWCVVGTYTGPDVGIHTQVTYQNAFGHHLVLMGMTSSPLDHPDGEVFECTTSDQYSMTDLEPLVLATSGYVGGTQLENEITMPEGMAVKLDSGQRYLIQAHYLNTGTEPFVARDALLMDYLDPDTEVDVWAAPFVLNKDDFSLPPGEATTASFDCEAEADWNALYLNAHMHEWGRSFTLERVLEDGNEPILDIPEWDPYFRDAPPTNYYEPGEFWIHQGDVLRTTCNWFNDTDAVIEFPHEMCDSVGLVYPQLTPVICNGGGASE